MVEPLLEQFINDETGHSCSVNRVGKTALLSDMMLGEPYRSGVQTWSLSDYDSATDIFSPLGRSVRCHSNANGGDYSPQEAYTGLQRYLPSNERDSDISGREMDSTVDAYSCDHFRMFEFKVRRCARGRSHDWTECPYAHPGEKARRRDPTKYHYSGTACPDFRKGSCKKGDSCEFSHGVFECWLHPARYRTQPCKDGTSCRRRVCFFAHTAEQLRLLPHQSPRSPNAAAYSYDGSPLRHAMEASSSKNLMFLSSPTSSPPMTPQAESPPMSPMAQSLSRSFGASPVGEMAASLRNLQISKLKSLPSAWNVQVGSPRGSILRPEGCSLPATPTRASPRSVNGGYVDFWDQTVEEEPVMERVESGRGLRAKMFEKLRKDNFTNESHPDSPSAAPDVGWISELVQ